MTAVAPEARKRLDNKAKLWRARYESCTTYVEVVRHAFDRARAAARAAERGGDKEAMKDLAHLLTNWSEAMERREAQRTRS